jgi:hypothetical protein
MQTSGEQGQVAEDGGALLTPAAAARSLGISRKSVSEAIKAGRLKARNLAPRVWLIEPADLEAYRERARTRKRRAVSAELVDKDDNRGSARERDARGGSSPAPEDGGAGTQGAGDTTATVAEARAPERPEGQARARCPECGAFIERPEGMSDGRCARCREAEDLRAAVAELEESVRKAGACLEQTRAGRGPNGAEGASSGPVSQSKVEAPQDRRARVKASFGRLGY